MSYLYLNFIDNLEQGSKNWDDFYTSSLNEQYEVIKRRIGNNIETLQSFIAEAFPRFVTKKYYISMPSFYRIQEENKRGKTCVNNIIIRPEHDEYISRVLPANYDVILIGDLTFDTVIAITVKGIELIDSNIAKFGERAIVCNAASAFTTTTFNAAGRTITVPDYGQKDIKDAVLTRDFITDLCEEVFPVPQKEKAIKTLQEWEHYIQFRKYYLGKQSERCEFINNVEICNSYMITKETYRRDEERLSPLLLHNIPQFSKGEQVILSQSIQGSDSFPLICVSIERNRKEILSETIGKNGHGRPKYEVYLQRYTRDAMGLSKTAPEYDENGNLPKSYRFNQYLLGERYLFTYVDKEPDTKELENKYAKQIEQEQNNIEKKYASIIKNELEQYLTEQGLVLRDIYSEKLSVYKKDLDASLEKDIEENNDKEVKKAFEAKIAEALAPLDAKRKQDQTNIRSQYDAAKKSKTSNDELDDALDKLRSQAEWIDHVYYIEKEKIVSSYSLRDFYVQRNKELIEKKSKSLSISSQAELNDLKKEKENQLNIQYKQQKETEKTEAKEALIKQFEDEKAIKIEDETTRIYRIYFRPNDINDKISEIQNDIDAVEPVYLTYDNRAEKVKIERQEKALTSISKGYVKNPYLPTYLFAPTELKQVTRGIDKEPDWCLESLNDVQKLAVKRALASESIFLLQGPPGTGKTQVIAEITAQLAKQGKKVLISSETHKAIDNVFERLPKIPEIRPLRLIPTQNEKTTNYSPEKLVDNFYANICGNLEKQVNRFEHFEETKDVFNEEMKKLRIEYDKLLRLKIDNAKAETEREKINITINKLNEQLEMQRAALRDISNIIEDYTRTEKVIESYRFSTDGTVEKFISAYRTLVEKLIHSFECFDGLTIDKLQDLVSVNVDKIKQELPQILSEDTLVALKSRHSELRNILQSLRDPDTDDAPQIGDPNYTKYKEYQSELKSVRDAIQEVQTSTGFDFSESLIITIAPNVINNKEVLKKLPEDITAFRIKLQTLISEIITKIEEEIKPLQNTETEIKQKIADIQLSISENKKDYEEIGNNVGITDYNELNSILKKKITGFFRDFNIIKEYDSENLDTAFDIIRKEWAQIEFNYNSMNTENRTKIPMFKEIIKYLSQDDIIEEDRQSYTRDLYNCANVFGITCTSRDRFTNAQLQELGRYGIETVDIKKQGIDVVIVDEVSKSSFLDLLIPILYGKTIILVGDHRQLPPMYDLRHLRKDDFEGLDEDIINETINKKYTDMYEECFFKTLYEKVPEDFKVMLTKQYRCHSHIMEVFNHFYGGTERGLTIGKKQQDIEKEHGLTVKIGGHTIIDPKYHIYFVDCEEKESSAYEGSTSKINEQEAEVTMKLLKELDGSASELIKQGKIKFDSNKKIDERPSVGVICTYGDQAGLIKKKTRKAQFNSFSGKQDERLIISTVDDFQGDERDIIILSMVRNPAKKNFDVEFIKKFERINVALSRARKLLIIVGARKFLTEEGIIDLPDLSGDKSRDQYNFHVYERIIDTIYMRGKVLVASDIIGG